uniref:Uncharacterized protein n=1 Tax=viral metagenome TaxID=1070528 RepID=A0A6M3KSS2_9ZZZZ
MKSLELENEVFEEGEMNDTERLDWVEKQDGMGLISDDAGRWAMSTSGMQNVPDCETPIAIASTFFVEAEEWKPSIREAIDYAIEEEQREVNEAVGEEDW